MTNERNIWPFFFVTALVICYLFFVSGKIWWHVIRTVPCVRAFKWRIRDCTNLLVGMHDDFYVWTLDQWSSIHPILWRDIEEHLVFEVRLLFDRCFHGLRTPRESFQTFGLGQTNWAEKFGDIWGVFSRFISTYFGTASPLSMFSIINQALFQFYKN